MNSQIKDIINKINIDGYVDRNWALKNYIGRLASRITDLKEMGWEFEPKRVKEKGGTNFYYYLISSPIKKTIYKVEGIGQVTLFNN